MIIFRASLSQQKKEFWELGIPFLKKYQMVFNSDTKKIGYYISKNINNDIIRKDIKEIIMLFFPFELFWNYLLDLFLFY